MLLASGDLGSSAAMLQPSKAIYKQCSGCGSAHLLVIGKLDVSREQRSGAATSLRNGCCHRMAHVLGNLRSYLYTLLLATSPCCNGCTR